MFKINSRIAVFVIKHIETSNTVFTKTHILWVDILSFVLAVALAAVVYKAVPAGKGRAAGIILSAALVAAMVLLTLFPPQIPLFMDPAGFYGMPV